MILVDDQPEPGGSLLGAREALDGEPALDWVAGVAERLAAAPEVRVLPRSTAIGYYDANLRGGRRAPHRPPRRRRSRGRGAPAPVARPRRAGGAGHRRARAPAGVRRQRPPGRDAGRGGADLRQPLGGAPGDAAVVFTTNDSAYPAALDLQAAGVAVVRIVDARAGASGPWAQRVRAAGIDVHAGGAVAGTTGERRIAAVDVVAMTESGAVDGAPERIPCDLLAVSGGWSPAVHLFSQSRGRLRYDRGAGLLRAGRRGAGPAQRRRVRGHLRARGLPGRGRRRGRRGGAAGRASAPPERRASRSSPTRCPSSRRGRCGSSRPRATATAPGAATTSTCSATRPSPTCGAPPARACARPSTSSATRRSAPPPTRARPRT